MLQHMSFFYPNYKHPSNGKHLTGLPRYLVYPIYYKLFNECMRAVENKSSVHYAPKNKRKNK